MTPNLESDWGMAPWDGPKPIPSEPRTREINLVCYVLVNLRTGNYDFYWTEPKPISDDFMVVCLRGKAHVDAT